jgi:tRNA pseudouridine65 synthase
MELEVLYHDEHLIGINKKLCMLVHRSFIAADVTEFAIQILRDQIGQRVTPVHRLDRKTSGVLLFALSNEANRSMNIQFQENKVVKKYLAVVRGYTSLVEVKPDTGRMHQIRRHMDHIRHPIIGDRPHGCNKQNKLFRERWEMMTMLLHANSIRFHHPITNEEIEIKAKLQPEYIRSLKFLGFTSVL